MRTDAGLMDLYFQGMAWANKGITPDHLAEARRYLERALALDPANIEALVGVAGVDALVAANLQPRDQAERLAVAEAAAVKALSLAPDHPLAHVCVGMVQMYTNRVAQGIAECERALELDRNLAHAHGAMSAGVLYLDRFDEAGDHVREALRLSPRDPFVFLWGSIAGQAKFYLGREEEAIVWLRRSIEANRNYPMSHFNLAAVLACLGRVPEARAEIQAGLAVNPTFTIARFHAAAMSDNPAYLAGRERTIEGLRIAGVPE